MSKASRAAHNNRSNQLNSNNAAYHSSRQGTATPGGAAAPTPQGGDGSAPAPAGSGEPKGK